MPASKTLKADSLAIGISVMLIVTIVQRGVGFVRGILFCRYLDDASLGQWAMGFGFISLITPMLLFGLPGSLPRFVEHYLQKGQLRSFLKRILGVTSLITVLAISTMLLAPGAYANLVFGDDQASQLVIALSLAVASVIVFNVTNELTSGLRMVRVASIAQFVQSIAFTVLGIGWLLGGGGIAGVLVMFAVASLLGTLPAWWALARGWGSIDSDGPPLEGRVMWHRIVPYAAAIWAMNLLSNAFELADRYMLLHLSQGDAEAGQRFLGQYHSSLIIPCLFISLANMGSSVLTPYLVADWERDDKSGVAKRIERTLITISLGFTAAGRGCAVGDPLDFRAIPGRAVQWRISGHADLFRVLHLVFDRDVGTVLSMGFRAGKVGRRCDAGWSCRQYLAERRAGPEGRAGRSRLGDFPVAFDCAVRYLLVDAAMWISAFQHRRLDHDRPGHIVGRSLGFGLLPGRGGFVQ